MFPLTYLTPTIGSTNSLKSLEDAPKTLNRPKASFRNSVVVWVDVDPAELIDPVELLDGGLGVDVDPVELIDPAELLDGDLGIDVDPVELLDGELGVDVDPVELIDEVELLDGEYCDDDALAALKSWR